METDIEEVSDASPRARRKVKLTELAPDTVRMVRDEPAHAGGPVCADVHPDEVEDFLRGNWREAE